MENVEIDSIHTYDFRRARLSVALRWLLSAAYGAHVPHELREPLPLKDKDTVTAIYVNTGLVSLLVNSRLYIRASSSLFPQLCPSGNTEGGHWAVIQALSRLGVYVEDDGGQAITEMELVQSNPFQLTAHVSLIEAMMTAYTNNLATTDKVVQAVRAIGPFNASEDLPIDCEDALLVWMNKVSAACIRRASALRQKQLTANSPSMRVNKAHLTEISGVVPSIQPMDDILKDISDGCSLCTLVSFYCPEYLKFTDIHTTEPIGIGDSLHNISLVKAFCDSYLPTSIFHFTYEDILYSTDTIKPGLLACLTHLFHYFVLKPLDIVSTGPQPTANNNSYYTQGAARISHSSSGKSDHHPVSPVVVRHQANGPHHLISDVTKKSFQHTPAPPVLSNTGEHYGSNPSLNSSTSSSRLLHKRSSHAATDADAGMHDTLSPIVVRKSQSMGILSAPDPKQSLVAWENQSYYIDRSKPPNRASMTSNASSKSLLSNVSFLEGADDDYVTSSSDLNAANSAHDLYKHRSLGLPDRARSSSNAMSNSYQKLLDRSGDVESPLKLFAQKHGLQRPAKPVSTDSASGEVHVSTSPVDTSSDLTKITPRSDTAHSPRQHVAMSDRSDISVGQSYVISTALTPDIAEAAGIPVIRDRVSDSCTEVTFASIMDNDYDQLDESCGELTGSPVQPILIAEEINETPLHTDLTAIDSPVTSFRDMGMSKSSSRGLLDASSSSPQPAGLKQRFEQSKSSTLDAKPMKKTTFSLNQTTWSDHVRGRTSSDGDSDTHSENSEASGDRKQFSDVKILLEEKRKAMEKKKTLEEIERAKEVDLASRQAFLKAVAKNKGHANHSNGNAEPVKAFSRNDISKSIENLQSKWQQEEKNNAKRAAATTSAKSINVTPASLDNITEVGEPSEVEAPHVPLPAATTSEQNESPPELRERRSSSINLHELPIDVEQYGLDKLNASLSELRGEISKLSSEQRRIVELQNAMNTTTPQSRSTPRSKASDSQRITNSPAHTHSNGTVSSNIEPVTMIDPTFRLSELDQSTSAGSHSMTQPDMNSSSLSKSYHDQADSFSQPTAHSMTQSLDEPFILHNSTQGTSRAPSSKAKKSRPTDRGPETAANSSPRQSKGGGMVRANSNGFLSSSQLSRKKVPKEEPATASPVSFPASSMEQSAGRKKWTSNNAPLFPGYDDEDESPMRSQATKREPDMATQDVQPAFKPPLDVQSAAANRTHPKARQSVSKSQSSPEDTPMKEARRKMGFDTFEVRQLPGHEIPGDLALEDTPMRDGHLGTRSAAGCSTGADVSIEDTPMREFHQDRQQPADGVLDIPTRDMHHTSLNSTSSTYSNISGVVPVDDTPAEPAVHHHKMLMDTPARPHPPGYTPTIYNVHTQQQHAATDDYLDTRMRQRGTPLDTPMQASRRPQSMIEPMSREHLHNASIDTPMRETLRSGANQIFYDPHAERQSHHQNSPAHNMTDSFIDTPMRQPQAVSRHGTSSLNPPATSRHGSAPSGHPLEIASGDKRLVKAPYVYEPVADVPTLTAPYKLNTPYGNADNELSPADTNILLTSAMDAIRSDMMRQTRAEHPTSGTLTLDTTTHTGPLYSQSQTGYQQPSPSTNYSPGSPNVSAMARRQSSGSSEVESANTRASQPSYGVLSNAALVNSGLSEPALARRPSADNDDRLSVHSYGSGSAESAECTPRSAGKPKRATWDMSTPRGDLLNQPGVGFIVAEQAQLSEEELRRRKEKVILMQLRRREEQDQKKQQKAAELAAKAEAARLKELEAEKKKSEEKAKKEAIFLQFQNRRAEEDLPPEMRARFRQKQKRGNDRPASIHWAGSSGENILRNSDNLDTATSFTVSLASGNLTHRRPASPSPSSTAGSLSSRSKAPSRGVIEAPPDEYTGPKLYVKPSEKQKSNRTIIINAVSHCCLAGVVNTDMKNKVLEGIARSDGKHFLILFRDGNQTFKAVYSFCPDSEECIKLHGQGPKYIKDDMCHRFYKYNSGGKKFTELLSTKHLSVSIDAITIHNHLWQKRTAASSRR